MRSGSVGIVFVLGLLGAARAEEEAPVQAPTQTPAPAPAPVAEQTPPPPQVPATPAQDPASERIAPALRPALPLVPMPPLTSAPPQPPSSRPRTARDAAFDRRIEDRRATIIKHHLDAGTRLSLRGQHAEAARAFALAYAFGAQTEMLLRVAKACRKAELDLEALAIYEQLLEENLPAEERAMAMEEVAALRVKVDDPGVGLAQAMKEYLDTGKRHFQGGRHVQAAEVFAMAYAVKRLPRFLFNIAQAYRRSGPDYSEESYIAYNRFLAEDPETPLKKETQGYVAELRSLVNKPPVYRRAWFWGVLAAGAAAVAGGIGLIVALQPKKIPNDAGDEFILTFPMGLVGER